MADFSKTTDGGAPQTRTPDDVSVRRWLAAYGAFFLALAIPLAVLISRQHWTLAEWTGHFTQTFAATPVAIKLLAFALYLSLCTTFVPLPTGWIVAAVATRELAVGGDVWTTTLLVALVGALGSTVANLTDYYVFTWLLRHHRVAAIRETATYKKAAVWFARGPFFLLFVFNVIPIPVDVIRMLAITYRYPRTAFTAANFLGRCIRYAVIAYVTYRYNLGWYAAAALLAVAVVLGAVRLGPPLARKVFRTAANPAARPLSDTQQRPKES